MHRYIILGHKTLHGIQPIIATTKEITSEEFVLENCGVIHFSDDGENIQIFPHKETYIFTKNVIVIPRNEINYFSLYINEDILNSYKNWVDDYITKDSSYD